MFKRKRPGTFPGTSHCHYTVWWWQQSSGPPYFTWKLLLTHSCVIPVFAILFTIVHRPHGITFSSALSLWQNWFPPPWSNSGQRSLQHICRGSSYLMEMDKQMAERYTKVLPIIAFCSDLLKLLGPWPESFTAFGTVNVHIIYSTYRDC